MIRSLSHSPSTSPHPSSGDALPVAGPSTVIAPVDQPPVDPSEEGKKREGAAGEVGETSGKEQRQLYSTGEAVKGVSAVAESRQEDIQVTPGPREQAHPAHHLLRFPSAHQKQPQPDAPPSSQPDLLLPPLQSLFPPSSSYQFSFSTSATPAGPIPSIPPLNPTHYAPSAPLVLAPTSAQLRLDQHLWKEEEVASSRSGVQSGGPTDPPYVKVFVLPRPVVQASTAPKPAAASWAANQYGAAGLPLPDAQGQGGGLEEAALQAVGIGGVSRKKRRREVGKEKVGQEKDAKEEVMVKVEKEEEEEVGQAEEEGSRRGRKTRRTGG